jgi:hypothetical protein
VLAFIVLRGIIERICIKDKLRTMNHKKGKKRILFICTHNSAQSQMAEGSEKFGEHGQH